MVGLARLEISYLGERMSNGAGRKSRIGTEDVTLRALPSNLGDVASANLERLSRCLWAGGMSKCKDERCDKFGL